MSFPHAREGNERTATGAIGIFFPLPLACLSLSLQRFKRRAVIYYYYYRAAGKFTVPALSLIPDGR